MSKILIVEDVIDTQNVLRKRLSKEGFECVFADDGYQAVTMAHQVCPSLIILDLKLPGGNGLDVIKKLKLSVDTRYIPIIVLTGIKDDEYKRSVLNEGVKAYLEKPCDSYVFMSAIKHILEK